MSAQTERWVVHHGDALPWLRSLETSSADALVTDPPAGIGFMGKDWDRDKGGRADWVRWLAEILSSARRVLRPGAYGWVWALPRTSHWTGWACEEAGLEVRDVLTHVQAQGFPKSRALLKPGSEHWILVRKPGPLRDLRIDDCRVGTTKQVPASISRTPGSVYGDGDGIPKGDGAETMGVGGHDPNLGRWPANFALSHSADCARVGERRVRNKGGAVSPGTERAQGVAIGDLGDRPEWTPYGEGGLETVEDWECGEDCPVRALGEQSGRSRSRVGSPRRSGEPGRGYGMTATGAEYDDEGTADRFFHCFPCDPFLYCPKAPTSERSIGCEDLPAKRAAKFASGEGPQGRTRVDGEWVNTETPRRDRPNHHPTVKPVALMRHLVRLVAPRRSLVIDPFTGSGTTGVAALAEGMRFAGAEREAEYAEIARARLARAASDHPIAPLRTLPRR